MYPNRPRIKVQPENIDIILQLVSLTILICIWCYVIISYNKMPEIVPTHFNAQGEVDGTGSKGTIWFLMGITTIIAVGLHILTKYPHIHNYMVEITEENAAHNYKMSSRLLRVVNLLTLLLMSYIVFTVVRSALGKTMGTGNEFIYIMISFGVIMPIALIVYILKNQKAASAKK